MFVVVIDADVIVDVDDVVGVGVVVVLLVCVFLPRSRSSRTTIRTVQ